jgi:hypothetical protein
MAECYERRFPAQEPVLPFIRPPFYALALAPLTALGPEAAMWAWMVLNIAALAAAALLTAQATGIESSAVALLAALFFPSLYAFFNRQDAPLVAALAAAGYALAARGRDRAAGLALAAAAIKFHLLVMMPVALLGRSRKPEARSQKRRVLEGFLVGVGLLVAISLVMVGPAGLLEYGRMLALRSAPNIEINPQRIANLSSLGGGSWIQVPLIALAAGAVLVAARRLPTPEAMAAAWLGSLVVAPHVYISDYLLALPACLLLARLGWMCVLPGVLLVFPLTPILMAYDERGLLATPLLAFLCLLGAGVTAFRRGEAVA